MVVLLWFIVVYLGSQQLVGQGGSVKMGGSLVSKSAGFGF